jgi:hypothetical protein
VPEHPRIGMECLAKFRAVAIGAVDLQLDECANGSQIGKLVCTHALILAR